MTRDANQYDSFASVVVTMLYGAFLRVQLAILIPAAILSFAGFALVIQGKRGGEEERG